VLYKLKTGKKDSQSQLYACSVDIGGFYIFAVSFLHVVHQVFAPRKILICGKVLYVKGTQMDETVNHKY
jgi:hypothetical protein